MSRECVVVVALEGLAGLQAAALHERSAAALARADKAPPGDRTDIVRHERAQSELEALAVNSRNAGAPSVMLGVPVRGRSALLEPAQLSGSSVAAQLSALSASGFALVQVVYPFLAGQTPPPRQDVQVPAEPRWPNTKGTSGLEAVTERFHDRVESISTGAIADFADVHGSGTAHETDLDVGSERSPGDIAPSGVANSALTRVLRQFAAADPRRQAVDAPVRYRDGSRARPFPLGAVPMSNDPSELGRTLRFALLSIRHVQLDSVVDGAWLRNAEVSRPRAMALTDELVYLESRKQLRTLTDRGPVTIVMFQTGLEPAILGLYRAVLHHLLERPGTVSVQPRFHHNNAEPGVGDTWRTP